MTTTIDPTAILGKSEQLGILVIASLNRLFCEPCCPECCAECAVLAQMLAAGELDEIVNMAPRSMLRGSVWQHNGKVNRSWLYGQWDPRRCINCVPPPPRAPRAKRAVVDRPPTPTGKACLEHRKLKVRCTCPTRIGIIG